MYPYLPFLPICLGDSRLLTSPPDCAGAAINLLINSPNPSSNESNKGQLFWKFSRLVEPQEFAARPSPLPADIKEGEATMFGCGLCYSRFGMLSLSWWGTYNNITVQRRPVSLPLYNVMQWSVLSRFYSFFFFSYLTRKWSVLVWRGATGFRGS